MAMLCKLGWALETNNDLLWVKALKVKYFPNTSFMRCGQKKANSSQWKGILGSKYVLAKEMCFWVGKGNKINFRDDPWIFNNLNFRPLPNSNASISEVGMVESLLYPNVGWNTTWLNNLFDNESVKNVLRIFWVDRDAEDEFMWIGSSSTSFKVKSVYKFMS